MNLEELIRDSYRENELLSTEEPVFPKTPEVTPSPGFLARMERLTSPRAARSARRDAGTHRRAAAVLLAFFGLTLMMALLFPGAVASFVRLVVRYESKSQVVEIENNPVCQERVLPLPVCRDPWLPPGYSLADYYADEHVRADYRYVCLEGEPKVLMISYQDTTNGLRANTDGLPESFQEIRIGGHPAVCYTSPDGTIPNQVSWFDEQLDTYYIISGVESVDVLTLVAESVAGR